MGGVCFVMAVGNPPHLHKPAALARNLWIISSPVLFCHGNRFWLSLQTAFQPLHYELLGKREDCCPSYQHHGAICNKLAGAIAPLILCLFLFFSRPVGCLFVAKPESRWIRQQKVVALNGPCTTGSPSIPVDDGSC